MGRRCNRCRVEYESGVEYGGHDYCMICYNLVKQEEASKKLKEELLRKQLEDRFREQWRRDYLEERARFKTIETAKPHEVAYSYPQSAQGKKKAEEEKSKKPKPPIELAVPQAKGKFEGKRIYTPLGKPMRKRKKALLESKPAAELEPPAKRLLQQLKKESEKQSDKKELPAAPSSLSLSVLRGLPASLSAGQQNVLVVLNAKNESIRPIVVELISSLSDSQKKQINAKCEPRVASLGPEGEASFRLEFDLPQEVSRGKLSLVSFLRENATYIDRQPAQSNQVLLSCQIRLPMDLKYLPNSAALENKTLSLFFDNIGESGGILEKASSASLSQDGNAKKAFLRSRVKIKGGQKNIRLDFFPAEWDSRWKEGIEVLLVGKDSNGKPYLEKVAIKEENRQEEQGKIGGNSQEQG